MKLKAAVLWTVSLALGIAGCATHEGGEGHGSHARLGTVNFPIGCNATAQREFNTAMAYYHSFAWAEIREPLERVLKADPSCGMAHWLRALASLDNPFIWPGIISQPTLASGSDILDMARKTGLKSQRERDYVDALDSFFKDHGKLDHRTRAKALEAALERVMQRYPEDKEAAILSALVTSANFNPTDKAYANQLKAARILEPLAKSDPDHPGVAHYLIHSYDYPAIAKHGVEAAKLYAKIAPDAAHALHMPSHIFTRLGHWRESIEANRASARSAGDATFDAHHAHDYMVYAHLQLAQDRAAREALDRSRGMKPVDSFPAAYAYAAMPARLALERSDWKEAMDLPLNPAADAYAWKKYPQAEAVNAFARGIGAARSGNAAAAREQQGRLGALREAAKEAKLAYWAEQIDIQAELVGSLALCAEGKTDSCIESLAKAAAREDATEKHVVTPGPIIPAREMLADILSGTGKATEALREYEAVLAKEPNRYRAILGASRAARSAGQEARARDLFKQLLEAGREADSARDGLDEARQAVGRG